MKQIPKKQIDVKKVISGLLNGDIVSLSKAITIVESDNVKDISNSNKIISSCLKNRTNSIRIGITGVPGVGKSTFIEAFGNQLTEQGYKVAILAIDPTSTVSRGSIMGDKTRMNTLVNNKNAFIRPSPASSHYGGVAKKTRESIILCEAAGYNIIIVETVGVGQNEISVSEMVDIFLLLKLSGAGDELQGIKRGIIEMADAIIINKADGDNIDESNKAMAEFSMALKLYPTKKSNWVPKVLTCSSINNSGIEPIWKLVLKYISDTKENKFFAENRKRQNKYWLLQTINDKLQSDFFSNDEIKKELENQYNLLDKNKTTPFAAAAVLLKI
ncbi:MAG: methylmalonyl Co-A mutase-associated GTPase MeaB [Flavobacteriales bacterium]|nr:MAG: methylmalonyl Co-A mutase-associated GTPase MeaB [Flavobacteriales bacterium]|tara:strand:+ start:518 stop:1504 length:987 start_codon:yes stop_codon:yes gene_type:complete